MKLQNNLLGIIARMNTPVKGYFGPHHGLNALNPQPLPPIAIGAMLAETYTQFIAFRLKSHYDDGEPGLGNDTDMIWIKIILGPYKEPEIQPNWWRRFGQEPLEREVKSAISLAFVARLHEIATLSNDEALNKTLKTAIETVVKENAQEWG